MEKYSKAKVWSIKEGGGRGRRAEGMAKKKRKGKNSVKARGEKGTCPAIKRRFEGD